jgi:type II secretion system protein H
LGNKLCNKGFTLIEIAAVLVIMALLTTLAIKHMGGGAEMSAYGDADRLVADLRYAQSLAMTRSQNITVEIDSDSWTISDFSFADGSEKREPKHGVTLPSKSKIEFLSDKGKVSSEQTIELKRGKKTINVKVYETGYVEIQ